MKGRAITFVVAGAALALAGCMSAEKELGAVAKRWSMTIRASQVLPVYPISEDLQPGDVFLVTTPLESEVETWNEKGFLPLPMQVVRLEGLDFRAFYAAGYWEADYAGVPHPRATDGAVGAPRAAFPSYDFEIERGSGLELALPVSGVPVGLGLMQADSAMGSLVIRDAFTYGVSMELAWARLSAWAGQPKVQGALAGLAATHGDELFLRVVNRVYLARGVSISLRNSGAVSAGVDVAEPKEIELLQTADRSSTENQAAAMQTLSAALTDALPGGSLRVAQASRSAVTLDETFDRPLAIGYVGFDVPVLRTGQLGAPRATLQRLSGGAQPVIAGELGGLDRELYFRELELEQIVRADPLNANDPNPAGAVNAVRYAAVRLPESDFGGVATEAAALLTAEDGVDEAEATAVLGSFMDAVGPYARGDEAARKAQVLELIDFGIEMRWVPE